MISGSGAISVPVADVGIDYELYTLTFTVASATSANVFEIMAQDTDDVISIINYLITRSEIEGENNHNAPAAALPAQQSQNFWDYV